MAGIRLAHLATASTATGIRTRVTAVRGRRPSPLDDSGARYLTRVAIQAGRGWGDQLRGAAMGQGLPCLTRAAVAELVDAQASGACVLRDVEVRVLSAASGRVSATAGRRAR